MPKLKRFLARRPHRAGGPVVDGQPPSHVTRRELLKLSPLLCLAVLPCRPGATGCSRPAWRWSDAASGAAVPGTIISRRRIRDRRRALRAVSLQLLRCARTGDRFRRTGRCSRRRCRPSRPLHARSDPRAPQGRRRTRATSASRAGMSSAASAARASSISFRWSAPIRAHAS